MDERMPNPTINANFHQFSAKCVNSLPHWGNRVTGPLQLTLRYTLVANAIRQAAAFAQLRHRYYVFIVNDPVIWINSKIDKNPKDWTDSFNCDIRESMVSQSIRRHQTVCAFFDFVLPIETLHSAKWLIWLRSRIFSRYHDFSWTSSAYRPSISSQIYWR